MVGTPRTTIITFLTNFTALKQPYLIFEISNTFEYQKLDRHIQAGLPVHYSDVSAIQMFAILIPLLLSIFLNLKINLLSFLVWNGARRTNRNFWLAFVVRRSKSLTSRTSPSLPAPTSRLGMDLSVE